jgi:putative transposase
VSAIGFAGLASEEPVRSLVNQDPRERQVSKPRVNVDAEITEILRTFALANPRQGYRKARRAVLEAGYRVNLKKIHRLWREAGLKVPLHKPKNKRAGHSLPMGAHQPTGPNITWAMDFQFDATTDGKALKLLNIIDEYSREYLDTLVDRSIDAEGVISALDGIVPKRGTPVYAQNGQWTFSSSHMP